MGTPNSRSSFGGPFCNPYDTERSPGTSSGGSGSSVAANLVTCAIGEETGGSIHHPAKNNSLVGLAPTQELVSRVGMIGAALNTRVGPLCRTVKDTARVLEVIAGYDPQDELTAFNIGRLPSEPYRSFANERTLNGMRIGVIREHMDKKLFTESHFETIDIVERGINDLRRPGTGGSAVSELHRQIRSALSQPGVHGAASGSVSGGCERKTGSGPHPSAGRYVLHPVPSPARFHDPQHQQRWQSWIDQIYARPLPAGARRYEYQVDQGFDR
jgi:Asp-tRNA(Asn)/Glu-tRNA(Gln) amidotransferase A subunit family amidase